MNRTATSLLLLAAMMAALAGCVRPAGIDPTVLNRYQEAMACRGPQRRAGGDGLARLRPAATDLLPPLEAEPVDLVQRVETTTTYTQTAETEEFRTVRAVTRVKTTTYSRNPDTGELTPSEDVQETRETVQVQQVPPDFHTVSLDRRGRRSGTVSLDPTAENLILLSLDEAVMRALAGNLDIRVESFQPAISREDMTIAASEFDWTLFGGLTLSKVDTKPTSPFATRQTRNRNWQFGVKKKVVTGAQVSAEWNLPRTWDEGGVSSLPNRWGPALELSVTQPLLRDAWPAVNLARLRIAALSDENTRAAFRQTVEDTVTRVVETYWALRQARQDYAIQVWLLAEARETLRRLKLRRDIDATAVEVKQTESALRSREAALVRSRKIIADTQDALLRLLADDQLNLVAKAEVVPSSNPHDVPVELDEADQLLTALRHNPVLEQARVAISVADVNVRVARNATLPRLDFTAATTMSGLDTRPDNSLKEMWSGQYVGYTFALAFEYPIGNRERLANLRKTRFQRLQAITRLQNSADQVAQTVREALRRVRTSYEELNAQRQAAAAAREQLWALDQRQIRDRITPTFLQLKLQAQETIAAAERAELQALAEYNQALIALARATGTVLKGTVLTDTILELRDIETVLPKMGSAPEYGEQP